MPDRRQWLAGGDLDTEAYLGSGQPGHKRHTLILVEPGTGKI
jgi:hypothetical protein